MEAQHNSMLNISNALKKCSAATHEVFLNCNNLCHPIPVSWTMILLNYCIYCASVPSLHSLPTVWWWWYFAQTLQPPKPWMERILHEISLCSLQRHRTCYLCAALDHVSSNCPQDLCSYCYRPKHRGRVSPVYPHSRPLWNGPIKIVCHFGMGPSRFVTLQTIVCPIQLQA